MPKRKRPSPSPSPDDEPSSSRAVSRQQKLCAHILTKKQKSLVAALRLGSGFERQKYSRRRKTAKDKNDEKAIARLDEEYKLLKALDIPNLAEQHLRKTIAKVKSLKDHVGLPESVKEIEKGAKEPALLNVTARLYKVTGVKKVVDECIEELKAALKVEGGTKKESVKAEKTKDAARKKAKLDEESPAEDSGEDGEVFASFDARIAAPSSAEEDSDDSLSDDRRPPSLENSDQEDFDIDALDASFTDGEDDSDAAIPRHGYILSDEDGSESSQEESEFEGFSEEDELKSKPKTTSKAPAQKVSTSTFLPSLSHAAYFSGSESEADDLDIDIAPKKNRRGQRARQKIWEQKFGDNAKHKKKDERNQGWDPKRGAVSDDRTGRDGRSRGPARGGRGPQASGENTTELGPRKTAKPKRDDVGALHPSWLAAKAAKEKKLMAKPEGTKIVFD